MDKDELIKNADKSIESYTELLRQKRILLDLSSVLKEDLVKLDPQAFVLDFKEAETLVHFNSLLNIALLELHVIFKHLLLSTKEWEKAYFLKQVYVLVHETLKVYHTHNKLLNQVTAKHAALTVSYQEINDRIKMFKKVYNYPEAFTDFRNTVVAHIDEKLDVYYDKLSSLKGDYIMKIVRAFTAILNGLALLSANIEIAENQLLLKKNNEIDFNGIKAMIEKLRDMYGNGSK